MLALATHNDIEAHFELLEDLTTTLQGASLTTYGLDQGLTGGGLVWFTYLRRSQWRCMASIKRSSSRIELWVCWTSPGKFFGFVGNGIGDFGQSFGASLDVLNG